MNDYRKLELKRHQTNQPEINNLGEMTWKSQWLILIHFFLISNLLLGFVMMSMFKMVVPGNTLVMPLSLVIFRLVFLKQDLSLFSFLHLLHTSKSQNISELHSLELSISSIFHPRTLGLHCDPSTFEILTCPMRLFGKITERNQIKKK